MKQADIFYKAMLARDYRFDGKFFVGVKTTGIYCRPICPAKPKRENVEFFLSSLSAEKSGYRPCLRCRPECAPLSPAWIGKSAVVNRALRCIANGELINCKEKEFANKFGMNPRHLRRLFREEVGMTPKQIFTNNRLNFARKLIVETNLPITEIAFTSNFSSIRRFNDAIKKRFSKSPSEIRRKKISTTSPIKLFLSYRPPFSWESLLEFYRSHQMYAIESIDQNSYSRVFRIDDNVGAIKVSPAKKNRLALEIAGNVTKSLYKIVHNVRQMFDLDSDPIFVANAFENCPLMSDLYRKYPGLRIPRGWTPFEISICTILGQLVSVRQGKQLIAQLITNYGKKVENLLTNEESYLFPTPEILSKSLLKKVKTTQQRRETINIFCKQLLDKEINLESTQDTKTFRQKLLQIKGIGPWTVEYVALRAFGDTNAFPTTDLILKRALKQSQLDIDSFAPWRSYVAMYLWKEFAKSLSRSNQ